ncbi:PREDICTED: protein YIPF3-like [Amphimedon queenslandica]|uniref:Protein YIPF3 n=2 Tax=Amphimedon queenslandica TaxID=400682 RepID=A0A1X7SYK9_AMPQE|nr:PREDICTED: protein YIPF3-like [Amphimedon queenslandica]|eukprot:XP_019862284.1 PREDICTED: protein YIPF3-like [Amphimedon queenslandica]
MLVFTLVAILLYGMKTSGHTVEDGTLIGTALVVCMGYWFGLSLLSFFISYLLTAHVSLIQLMSLIGYSLTAHCIILSLSTVFDHYGTPVMFYLFWIIFGLLTTCKQVGILLSRSWSLRDGLILSLVIGSCHMCSILYLRFMYHRVYEALAEAI